MKKVLAIVLTLTLMAFGTAFAQTAAQPAVTLTFSENPTTGYQWSFSSGDEAILTITDNGYAAAANPTNAEGVGGAHSWTLTGNAEGDTTATFTLGQNWEGGEETAKLTYTFHVDADKNLTQTAVEGIPEFYMPDRAAFLLAENPTTGFEWAYKLSADGILTFERDVFESPTDNADNTALAGAGGAHLWVFKTAAPGDVVVTFAYARSWEENVKPEATVTYKCHVDDALNVSLTEVGGDYETYDLILGSAKQ